MAKESSIQSVKLSALRTAFYHFQYADSGVMPQYMYTETT